VHDTRDQLGRALRQALKARDTIAVSALRSALSAIANAEAVEPAASPPAGSSEYIASAVSGPGGGDVPRRTLTDADVTEIVRAEIADRLRAADDYRRSAKTERAERLQREASVLTAQLPVS
jgi:uncharacterized protein